MRSPEAKVILGVQDLSKCYGSVWAVRQLSFEVYEGEILVLLGPSGCGKSTTLRLLAGLERPDSGQIRLKGKIIVHAENGICLSPEKRRMGMVFQSFAVWPHMTVEEHLAFPLMVRNFPKREVQRKVRDMLAFVGLSGLEQRLSTQLSGGQQQRLALARALVYEPDILLLDEPLSNLDAKLRHQMRLELKGLQKQLATTFVYVTHDQVETMTLADRVALMKDGEIEQIGAPEELYEKPDTFFVHSFLGTTIAFEGQWIEHADGGFVQLPEGYRLRPVVIDGRDPFKRQVLVTVRPEDLQLIADKRKPQVNEIEAVVENTVFMGNLHEIALKGCGTEFVLQIPRRMPLREKEQVLLSVNPERIKVWPL